MVLTPADRTRMSGRSDTIWRNNPSAIGLRQTFPVQTNKIFLSPIKPRKGDMTNMPVQEGWNDGRSEGWMDPPSFPPSIPPIFHSSNLPSFFPLSGWESQDSMSKLNSVSASDHIQALYRLLLIRTGRRIEAEHAVRSSLTKSLRSPDLEPAKADFAAF